jgi:hypothetical protein
MGCERWEFPPFSFFVIINATMKQHLTQKLSNKVSKMSLKESHRVKMLLAEEHERELIVAEATAMMILEALDNDDIGNATVVLKKLNSIAKASPPLLAASIKAAADEVNDFTGGGIGALVKKGGAWLAKKFGAKAGTNPILKALVLLNSLEVGFSDAVDVIKNNAPDFDGDIDKSLMDQVDDKAAGRLRKILSKAFQPDGIFAKIKSIFGSTGGIPYVKNVDKMIEEIMLLPANKLTLLIKAATTGESSAKAAEAAKDMVTVGKQGGSPQAAKSNEPVKSVDNLAAAVATGQTQDKGGDVAAKATTMAQENPKKVVKQLVDDISKRSNQDAGVVEKVLSALIKKGKIKTQFSVTEEGYERVPSNYVRLSMKDVIDAQMALLECGGSIKNWVDILFEVNVLDEKTNKGGQKRKAAQAKKKAGAQVQQPPSQQQQQQPEKDEQPSQESQPEKKDDAPAQQTPEKTSNPIAKEIQDSLKDVDINAIEAILDAIPPYLKLEVARHRSRVI